MQTPLQLDIWLQSYEEFVNAKNNIKERNWNTVFANISKPISPTSDSFLLIMYTNPTILDLCANLDWTHTEDGAEMIEAGY